MRLILLRSTCDDGRTCPNINITDRDTYVVQGYVVRDARMQVDAAPLGPDEAVVRIPRSLVPEARNVGHYPSLDATPDGIILVRGRKVTDAGALALLALPPHEDAVEVPRAAMPHLEFARAR